MAQPFPQNSMTDHKDVIRCNQDIKDFVELRMTEAGITINDLCKEANEIFMLKLTPSNFSRWINADRYIKGFPTQKQILWICHRLGITLTLKIELDEEFNYKKSALRAQQFINNYNEL